LKIQNLIHSRNINDIKMTVNLIKPQKQIVFISVILVVHFIVYSQAYCWQSGWNPSFTAPLVVSEIQPGVVRVSWEGIVDKKKCADNFLVKYWKQNHPQDYTLSNKTDANADFLDIRVKPSTLYAIQAIAIENKGMILGVDYNKSRTVKFTSARINNSLATSVQPNENDCPACCRQNGLHPNFTGPPVVSQIQPLVVRVSWADIVDHKMCADSFLVKYWKHDGPYEEYRLTKGTKDDFVDIWFSLHTRISFEVIAREDQGIIGTVDHRSQIVNFTLGATDSTFVTTVEPYAGYEIGYLDTNLYALGYAAAAAARDLDFDNDGIIDALDNDDDNDGIPNSEDKDDDNDGIPNDQDNDDDNDGIPDELDVDVTTDGDLDDDGIPDSEDVDDDNDGVPDALDTDDDNTGIPDHLDNDEEKQIEMQEANPLLPYKSILSGTCESNGLAMISTKQECKVIVGALNEFGFHSRYNGILEHWHVKDLYSLLAPFGCLFTDDMEDGVYWSEPISIHDNLPCGSKYKGKQFFCLCMKIN